MKILITGASGFIGSFMVEEALRRGDEVWAGVRRSSSLQYLRDVRIRHIELDFAHPDMLVRQLKKGKKQMGGSWDVIIHCAGVTKCHHRADFVQGNYLATRHFVEALIALQMVPQQFVYLSSLSVYGPIHEEDYSPIKESDTPHPNTAYAQSKLQAEQYLQGMEGFPYVILRPTGVYGPREKDYFLMAKTIKQRIDLSVGSKRQDLTFVYVKDLVQAAFLTIDKGVTKRAYFVTDGSTYSSSAFSDLLEQELDIDNTFHVNVPLWLLKTICYIVEGFALLMGRNSTLNRDKYHIMKQRNWQCDISPMILELGYRPSYPLSRGVKEAVAWYKENGWL